LAATTAPGRVRFLGALDDVHPVLAAIETLVIPSVTEGIPAVAIEASLSALPVVASDVGGMSEVVLNGATGYLVPPGDTDALQHAVGDALTNRSALGAAARDHCMAHFTMGRVGQQWSDLIDCVLDGSSSRVGGRRPTPGR
jgi:glycosyltransferase involved in cell wall biosynthesis